MVGFTDSLVIKFYKIKIYSEGYHHSLTLTNISQNYNIFIITVPKKEGVPDINTNEGYKTLKALCPGKSRIELSAITANCLKPDDNGNINCDDCPEGE